MTRLSCWILVVAGCSAPSAIIADCPTCPRMVALPGGTFVIGSPASEPMRRPSEGPQRTVTLAAFAISEAETTRAEYAAFVDDTHRAVPDGCLTEGATIDGKYELDLRASWRAPGYPQAADHPVVCVSWQDAKDYAAWLSRKTGHAYDLPSEAQWEFAARAGTHTVYFWGDDRDRGCGYTNGCDRSLQRVMPASWPAVYAACDDGATYTTPARHYQPNAFGLYDMTGNAWEWTADCYERAYDSLAGDGAARDRADCPARVDRGGSWDDDPGDMRNASRHKVAPATREYDLGFRLVRRL